MARLGFFLFRGFAQRMIARDRLERGDFEPVAAQPNQMLLVVGEQAHPADAQISEDLGADAVLLEIRLLNQRAVEIPLLLSFHPRISHHRRAQSPELGPQV